MRLLLALLASAATALGAQRPLAATPDCSSCGEWNTPQAPVRLHGNAWYVGTHGLSAVLITSPAGHVLIDGGLRESAPLIAASIRSLGFRLEDVRLILNTHVHYDHAGGLGLLQQATGARVAALAEAADVLRSGKPRRDDPQFELLAPMDPVGNVQVVAHGDTLQVGPVVMTAHRTSGHAPGGTTWTWQSCDSIACREMVYADSQSPISADGFRFTTSPMAEQLRVGHRVLEGLRCEILVTPHPEASGLWERVAARDAGKADALVDREACKRYAAAARQRLEARLATEGRR